MKMQIELNTAIPREKALADILDAVKKHEPGRAIYLLGLAKETIENCGRFALNFKRVYRPLKKSIRKRLGLDAPHNGKR